MSSILRHPILGLLKGKHIGDGLTRFHSLPYASIPFRFARAKTCKELPRAAGYEVFDATCLGPCSIQIDQAAHNDAKSNQLPTDDVEEQQQDENCLSLTVTIPTSLDIDSKLPVLVFIHGGAFFLGSGDRHWLDPTILCEQASQSRKPIIFVSINYRLGLLGFLHSPEASDLLPANNALHDQLRAFDWIKQNISGFGGDPDNITAIGQSAGGESLSLHNLSGNKEPLYKRCITFSGTLVTMPAKTPEQYQATFLETAQKMDISTHGRNSRDIAEEMLNVNIDKIRKANFVGAPCAPSEILAYEKPTMQLMRSGPISQVEWLQSHIVSVCTYDGSISYVITHNNKERKDHAAGFIKLAYEILQNPEELLDIYSIRTGDRDIVALEKICQFESDIGFVSAAMEQASGMRQKKVKTYLQIFDLGNPFEGLLSPGNFASHTFDIVALLGAYEERQSEQYRKVIRQWRGRLLEYVFDGTPICGDFSSSHESLLIDGEGVRIVPQTELPGVQRRDRLWRLARNEKGDLGLDFLWEGLCRRWLDQGC